MAKDGEAAISARLSGAGLRDVMMSSQCQRQLQAASASAQDATL